MTKAEVSLHVQEEEASVEAAEMEVEMVAFLRDQPILETED